MSSPVINVESCQVCGSRDIKSLLRLPIGEFVGSGKADHAYDLRSLQLNGQEPMGYATCRSCSFSFATPTTSLHLEHATYNDAKAGQRTEKSALWADPEPNALYQTHHKWVDLNPFIVGMGFHFSRFRLPRIPNQRQLKLLDIGCGYGHTLELSRVFGVDATGCDVDEARLDVCRQKGLSVQVPDQVLGKFDIVLSCNVIEHVYDIQNYIASVALHLDEAGVFVFSGLDLSIVDIEVKRKRFKLLHPIEHRNVMTRASLERLLLSNGLRLISRGELFETMKQVRSKAPLYLPYWIRSGYVAINGVFSAIARHI